MSVPEVQESVEHDWRNPERVAPWKPRQKFRVTPAGEDAAQRYREAMTSAQQSGDPRTALDQAKADWATGLKLRPQDGILLEEMAAGRSSLADLQETLDALGTTLREARGTLDRLVAAALVEPQDAPSVATPPHLRSRPF